jgi:glycosyltransferase involved in cell wall biosynthesis
MQPPEDGTGRLILLSLAHHSGMGRFAAEFADAAYRLRPDSILVAPAMEIEPAAIRRVRLRRNAGRSGALGRLAALAAFNLEAVRATWSNVRPGDLFVIIDLYSTVPLSILPVFAARVRGARTVLNLHDFYPHALRYPTPLQWLERWFFRFAYRRFDLIAPNKPEQARQLETLARVPPERIVQLAHGPFPLAGVRAPDADAEVTRVLVLGSLRRNKRILQSIEAIAALQREGVPIALRIAGAPRREEGGYWASCREALENMRDVELTDRFVAETEMPAILSDVDALLCPYESFSSQSGVTIVGVSNAIPVIGTEAAGIANLAGAAGDIHPIATPVTADTVAAALRAFVAIPRRERRARAEAMRDAFLARRIWERNIESLLARLRSTEGGQR